MRQVKLRYSINVENTTPTLYRHCRSLVIQIAAMIVKIFGALKICKCDCPSQQTN